MELELKKRLGTKAISPLWTFPKALADRPRDFKFIHWQVLKGSGFQPRAMEGSSFQKRVAHVGTLFGHKGLHSMVTFDELFAFLITWGNLVPT